MSQEENQEQATDPTWEAILKEKQLEQDWALQNLLHMVNSRGMSMGITLIVGGTIVTGKLVGGAEYWKKFGDQFAEALTPGEDAEAVRKSFAANGEIYPADADKPKYGYNYIHIDECRIAVGGNFTPTNGMLWRGRISEVDGFTLGTLSPN